jgi:cytosine/adenosine deaminase-related metal-dependent hydrolase
LAPTTLIHNATILTMNDRLEVFEGAVLVRDGRIAAAGPDVRGPADVIVDAQGGFVQTHVHLCQTLFRGSADDMPLLEWLRRRVWPLEAAHTPDTLRASVRLAAAELLLSGTTTVLTMETVHDTDVVFEALAEIGLRATVGKCMMDASSEAPARLQERTRSSIDESLALKKRWDGAAGGRLRAAFAPRFAVSCSTELLETVATLAGEDRAIVHTHASESRDEVEVVRQLSGGRSNLEYLAHTGLATSRLCVAHCIWISEAEQALIAERGVKVLHCPGSNLKLGSGIAPVTDLRRRGVSVSLGADGAACNNRLDMFEEMRLAATLQAVRCARCPDDGDSRGGSRARARRRDRLSRGRQARRSDRDRSRPHPSRAGHRPLVEHRLCGARLRRPPDDGGRGNSGEGFRGHPARYG